MKQRLFHFLVALAASIAFIALLPDNVIADYRSHDFLFVVSSAFVIYFIADGIRVSGSLVSAQALIGLVWFMRFFLPNLFIGDSSNSVLKMVGMTDVGQFQIATVVANAATLVTLGATSLFGRLSKPAIQPSEVSWPEVSKVALRMFGVGLTMLAFFLIINVGSLSAAAIDGSMRSSEVTRGTGYLFYVGLVVIPSSLVFAYSQYQRTRRLSWVMWVPAIVAFFALTLLGGRVRALIPLAAVGFLFLRIRNLDRPSLKSVMVIVAGVLVLFLYLPIGMAYRSGGIDAVLQLGFERFIEYTLWTIPGEMGQLHGPYLALAHGEGYLEGQTYRILLWPLSDFFNWGSKNTGVLLRDFAVGQGTYQKSWGFHASLIGDAVINFGRWFIPIKFAIFGCVMGWIQSSRRRGVLIIPTSILSILGLVRSFSESTDKIPETYVYIGMVYAILVYTRFFSKRPPAMVLFPELRHKRVVSDDRTQA